MPLSPLLHSESCGTEPFLSQYKFPAHPKQVVGLKPPLRLLYFSPAISQRSGEHPSSPPRLARTLLCRTVRNFEGDERHAKGRWIFCRAIFSWFSTSIEDSSCVPARRSTIVRSFAVGSYSMRGSLSRPFRLSRRNTSQILIGGSHASGFSCRLSMYCCACIRPWTGVCWYG
jgi:hypothetical protein